MRFPTEHLVVAIGCRPLPQSDPQAWQVDVARWRVETQFPRESRALWPR